MVFNKVRTQVWHQKDVYYDEIGLCAQNVDVNLGSLVNTIGRCVIIQRHSDQKLISTYEAYNVCNSTSILELHEMVMFIVLFPKMKKKTKKKHTPQVVPTLVEMWSFHDPTIRHATTIMT